MKKTLKTISALTLCIVLSACGTQQQQSSSSSTENSSSTSGSVSQSSQSSQSNSKSQSQPELLPNIHKIPRYDIYVNAPAFQAIEEGYTDLFIVHNSRYVAIVRNKLEPTDDLKKAHEVVFNTFKLGMTNYEGGVNSLKVEKEEIKEINGMEVYCFEGTLNYGRATIRDLYVKGYSFIREGIPMGIIGSVIDDKQQQELLDEVSHLVDEMVKTVRNTP